MTKKRNQRCRNLTMPPQPLRRTDTASRVANQNAGDDTWTCTVCGTSYEWGWDEDFGNINVPAMSTDGGDMVCDACFDGSDFDDFDGGVLIRPIRAGNPLD